MKLLMLLALLLPTTGFGTYNQPIPIQLAAHYQAHVITAMSPKYLSGWKNASLHRHMVDDLDAKFIVVNDPRAEYYPGQTVKMVGDHNVVKVIVQKNILQDFQYFNQTKVVCVQQIQQTAGGLLGIIEGFIAKVQQVIEFVQDVIGFLQGANLVQVRDAVKQCQG